MKVIDPGHVYELEHYDLGGLDPIPGRNRLYFMKREGPGYPGNVGHYSGTNLQECWRAEIDRLRYLDGQEPCWQNKDAIAHLQSCIWLLESRAAARHGRALSETANEVSRIEKLETCSTCGHVEPGRHNHDTKQ